MLELLADELLALGRERGLAAVGIASAEPFTETLEHLQQRKASGMHGGMNFTYRDPVRSTDPSRLLPGARSILVGALSYRTAEPAALPVTGARPMARVARYSRQDHYAPLRDILSVLADRLVADGWRAAVTCDENFLVDRAAAHRAGLGWFGKNTVLLLTGQGSWHVLGSVVTDAPLPATGTHPTPPPSLDPPVGGCGTCSRCVDACPTGALVAPGVLDARRCLAWLVQATGPFPIEYRIALGDRLYGCDVCQEVCPPNRTTDRRDPAPAAANEPEVDLLELLGADDATLLALFGRWYIPERQPRYLRRNALVVLGNVGDGRDPEVESTLVRVLGDPDPLIRGHAVWAASRLGRHDLLVAMSEDEADNDVRAELAVARTAAGAER